MKLVKFIFLAMVATISTGALADPVGFIASAAAAAGADGIVVLTALAGTGKFIAFGVSALGGPAVCRRKSR
jgi:hypothetical protein